jgi:hypothetical protein
MRGRGATRLETARIVLDRQRFLSKGKLQKEDLIMKNLMFLAARKSWMSAFLGIAVPRGLRKQFPISFMSIKETPMCKQSFLFVVALLGMLVPLHTALADQYDIKDSTKPGDKITFWFTTGPAPTDKASWLEYRQKSSGTWSGWSPTTPFTGTDASVNGTDWEFRPREKDKSIITDWHQEIKREEEGGKGTSIVRAGNIKKESPWSFQPLSELPDIYWRIPDLAPISGDNPDLTIYTAVNMDLYLQDNPLGFNGGNWSVGQSLDDLGLIIQNGEIAGVEGIYWSTSEFTFAPDSLNGFTSQDLLNSDTFGESIGIIAAHSTTPIPAPSAVLLAVSGLAGLAGLRRKGLLKQA